VLPTKAYEIIGVQYQQQLRFDKQPCSPALLLANRQIYHEIIDMWYATATFEIHIHKGVYYLDSFIEDQKDTLPANFRRIRSLAIDLTLDWMIESEKPWTSIVAECFSTGPYKLSELAMYRVTWRLAMLNAIRYAIRDGGIKLQNILSWNLAPLQTLRGVKLSFEIAEPKLWNYDPSKRYIADVTQPDADLVELNSKLKRLRRKALEQLAEIVAQPA
jgi:hypothetical protein